MARKRLFAYAPVALVLSQIDQSLVEYGQVEDEQEHSGAKKKLNVAYLYQIEVS
jgi:hypothetical protein